MPDALLPYYEQELNAIRKLADQFGAANPKVAGRLRMAGGTSDDPNVERLLEGVSFLAARVQYRLDDELPGISDALLELLCPHVLAPVPSLTTVKLIAKPEATGPSRVSRNTPLESGPVGGQPLKYRTCHDTVLWPIAVAEARLAGLPLAVPVNPQAQGASSVLRIVLKTTIPGLTFDQLGVDRLKFHIWGEISQATQIIELLCTSTLSIALADGPADARPTILGPECLSQVGFARDEAALPRPQRAFDGHRLLSEYFAFPQKFLYLEITDLERRAMITSSDRLEIFIYLSRSSSGLERVVSAANFVLGCSPAVNLFQQPLEQVSLDGSQSDWLLIPNSRLPKALEIYSVETVRISYPNDLQPRDVPYFHRLRLGADRAEVSDLNWFASRRLAPPTLGGTEMRLMLRDHNFDPARPADGMLSIDALCCSRDLPALLPFGGTQQSWRILDPTSPAAEAECLIVPTPTLRPQLREGSAWRLVSHLALNHLGVTGGPQSAMALREMLRLHDLRDTPESRLALEGIVSVTATPGVARVPGMRPGSFARGLDLSLTYEPQAWSAGGLFLLSAVLERFFSLQVSVNAFVRTSASLRGRSGNVATWPARSGSRILL